ncbi:ATPase MORC2-like [Actinia tenebrosa]|uniref:ATPase MORC2-like n=1 Tax=Actinia tenebrosa TaxID=6105 RepID=A0A6P8HM61_ACTTE|nr:ATPase MORC2-like [Actinia tenebrosa]
MATCDAYASIARAQLTFDYLHTNSTTHEFLFGALAELVDNARDAASKRIDIYSVPAESYRGKYMLCFLDDGDGMDPDEVANVIKFGRSDKRIIDKNMIGQYGNGLKSGTMRIAKDVLLFTKKDNKLSCLFISRTFQEKEKIFDEIIAPMPAWDAKTKKPLLKKNRDPEQHKTEVDIITKYSPFKTTEDIFNEFDKIKSTGTLVLLFNMSLMDNGEPELNVTADPYDIVMADPYVGESYGDDNYVIPERKSFRAYTSVLYLDPRMKIYIQDKKVRTVRLTTSLYKTASYTFMSKRFKCRLEREEKKAATELKTAEAKAHELEIQDREEREKAERTCKDSIAVQRQAGARLAEARADVNIKKMILNNTRKALKDPQSLEFIFGINLNKRRCYGVMVYNCNRLIKMYEKVGCQMEGGVQGYGVMGVVNVPYLVLEPTHNKQDFADGKEYKALTRALGEHLDDYWKNCPISKLGVVKFWDAYGYNSAKWKDDPSNEERYVRKRMMDLPLYVQCDKCLKWRELAFHSRYVLQDTPDNWCCKMNPDTDCNNCQRPEKKPATITRAILKKRKVEEDINRNRPRKGSEQSSESVSPAIERPKTSRESTRPIIKPKPQPPPQQKQPVRSPLNTPILPKPKATTSKTRTPIRLNTKSSPSVARPVKHERPPQQKVEVSSKPRPAVDSTNSKPDKQQKAKRPHPDTSNTTENENVKRRKSDVTEEVVASTPEVDSNEMDWSSEGETVSSCSSRLLGHPGEGDITSLQGRPCEGETDDGKWHVGTVVCLKERPDGIRVKVKFQQHPSDKFDKWYDYPGPHIRINGSKESTPIPPPSEPVSRPSPQPSPQPLPSSSMVELPSTTTIESTVTMEHVQGQASPVRSPDNGISSNMETEEALQDVAQLSRKMLEFFVPPEYQLTKEQLGSLSIWELRKFNVKDFCDKYEEGLGTIMNKITTEGKRSEQIAEEMQKKHGEVSEKLTETIQTMQQKETEHAETTTRLTRLQRKTARLIGMLNDNSDEIQIPDDSVEETLDNFITILENEGSQTQ